MNAEKWAQEFGRHAGKRIRLTFKDGSVYMGYCEGLGNPVDDSDETKWIGFLKVTPLTSNMTATSDQSGFILQLKDEEFGDIAQIEVLS